MASIMEAFNSNVTWLARFSYSLLCLVHLREREECQGQDGTLYVLSLSMQFLVKCLI